MRLRRLPVDVDSACLAFLLRFRPRLEQTRDIEPDIEPHAIERLRRIRHGSLMDLHSTVHNLQEAADACSLRSSRAARHGAVDAAAACCRWSVSTDQGR